MIPAHVGAERNISDAACLKKRRQEPKNFRMQIAEFKFSEIFHDGYVTLET